MVSPRPIDGASRQLTRKAYGVYFEQARYTRYHGETGSLSPRNSFPPNSVDGPLFFGVQTDPVPPRWIARSPSDLYVLLT